MAKKSHEARRLYLVVTALLSLSPATAAAPRLLQPFFPFPKLIEAAQYWMGRIRQESTILGHFDTT